MTNGEKYTTAKERAVAFRKYCDRHHGVCDSCAVAAECNLDHTTAILYWLSLEVEEEELLPCPFCGRSTHILTEKNCNGWWFVHCYSCDYRSMACEPEDYAIAAHNRVARAAKEKEAK